jgi:hypothetical protein
MVDLEELLFFVELCIEVAGDEMDEKGGVLDILQDDGGL